MTAARTSKRAAKAAPELTPWFPANSYPERLGEYEVNRKEYSRNFRQGRRVTRRVIWTGDQFIFTETDSTVTKGRMCAMVSSDHDKWRGLAADPSKAAV